jgi:hypothetical protein
LEKRKVGKISKIEMDCYKIKRYVQYTSKDYTSESTTQQPPGQAEDKENEGDFGQQLKESKGKNQTTIHPKADLQ